VLDRQLDWRGDHFLLAGYTFRLQEERTEATADDAFVFYKTRGQVEQFARFFSETDFRPRRALELGIWDGGSAAFWTETLNLESYAAIDIQDRGDSSYFTAWRNARAETRVSTHWTVSQTDRTAIDRILRERELTPLDIVFDDCSHQYAPTLASFEHLFPLVRDGGYYIVEDWAWALSGEFQSPTHPWAVFPPLHPIVHALTDLHGSRPDVIASIRVFPSFLAVERGPADVRDLSVKAMTSRRSRPWPTIGVRAARHAAALAKRRVTRRR